MLFKSDCKPLKNIAIIGGGTAGWLTAGIIAAEHSTSCESGINIILVESDSIPPIGVGEGTWPTMRSTLKKMGISETEFLIKCDASFKQGTKFLNWQKNSEDNQTHSYYHPFTLPHGFNHTNLATHWNKIRDKVDFAKAVGVQSYLGEHDIAPKQISTPEYDFNVNYGYHLDAGKFSQFLREHCVNNLGVKHYVDHVLSINSTSCGDIASITTRNNGNVSADLFIDCSGAKSLLLAEHYKIKLVHQNHILFNDCALAVHVPYPNKDSPINSFTHSNAQNAGWVWDIGLPSRRGVGYTYSSSHTNDENAEQTLRDYLQPIMGTKKSKSVELRKIGFTPGYREKFWHKNCVAVGLSAGFIEPLEATAISLVELSAKMISEQLPINRKVMDIVAKRFNSVFTNRWQNIIEFLKLHYVLSKRTDSQYWLDHAHESSFTNTLSEQLLFWESQAPYNYDPTDAGKMFPPASVQYILYGMGFVTNNRQTQRSDLSKNADRLFAENARNVRRLLSSLPTNRVLIDKIHQYGLPKI